MESWLTKEEKRALDVLSGLPTRWPLRGDDRGGLGIFMAIHVVRTPAYGGFVRQMGERAVRRGELTRTLRRARAIASVLAAERISQRSPSSILSWTTRRLPTVRGDDRRSSAAVTLSVRLQWRGRLIGAVGDHGSPAALRPEAVYSRGLSHRSEDPGSRCGPRRRWRMGVGIDWGSGWLGFPAWLIEVVFAIYTCRLCRQLSHYAYRFGRGIAVRGDGGPSMPKLTVVAIAPRGRSLGNQRPPRRIGRRLWPITRAAPIGQISGRRHCRSRVGPLSVPARKSGRIACLSGDAN
jgi:hypothetical protein